MTTSKKVLITGATGFIGGELLRRLIRRDARPIICLVRAGSPADAVRRGEQTLTALLGRAAPPKLAARVEWVPGDIEQPRLGLDEATWQRLAREVEEVYHCAASTRFDLPHDEAHRINVAGARSVFDLCAAAVAHGPFRRLHHVSTAYAAGRTTGEIEAGYLPEDRAESFRNSYEQTKAQAERFLRAHMDRVPITIYRPSIVVGDSRTGRTTSWNVVYFPMRLMAWGRLPYASRGGRALLDVVPVDHVVEAMIALGVRDDTVGGTYHLTAGEDALSVEDVIRHTYDGMSRRAGREVPVGTTPLGPAPWAMLAAALRVFGSEKMRKALDGFAVYVDYTRVSGCFSTAKERALLDEVGLTAPEPAEYFPRIVDYALMENFGKPRRPEPAPAPLAERFAAGLSSLTPALATVPVRV
jgi:thioester reductase-like protein